MKTKKYNKEGSLGSIGSGLIGATSLGIQNAQIKDTSYDEAVINSVENTEFSPGNYDNLLSTFDVNNMARTNYTASDIRGLSTGQIVGNTLFGMAQGAVQGTGLYDRLFNIGTALVGGIAGGLVGNKKAEEKALELNKVAENANRTYLANFDHAVENTHNTTFNTSLLNIKSKGGKICIKPNSRMNMFNKGGSVFQHGGIFSNGITTIENGGTHEENPFEGVQIGVDNQGIPNLVEEGEVIWNDYVFSNRLNVPGKSHSFAEEAKKLQRESEERPNDPISKNGLDSSMAKLMIEQEGVRQKEESNNNFFNKGGMKKTKNKSSNDSISTLASKVLEHDYYVNQLGFPTVEKGKKVIKEENFKNKIKEITGGNNPVTMEDIISLLSRDKKETKKNRYDFGSYLRYAPVVGSALGVFSDLVGTTNKPDYSNIDLIQEATDRITPVGYTPIGTYLSYNPLDKNFYSNKLAEQAGATRRAIVNQSINPGAAMAGLLAADYNAQTQLGGLFRQAEEYNQAQRERVAGFNRQTDAMNSEMAMKAAMANQKGDELRLKSAMAQAQMRDEIDSRANAARSANLTNLFDNIGSVGKEKFMMDIIEKNPALLYTFMGEYKGGNKEACGGKINRRRRK